MRTLALRLLSLSLPLMLAACSSGTDDASSGPSGSNDDGSGYQPAPQGEDRPGSLPSAAVDCAAGSATLEGRFLAPNGTTPVAGAYVYVASADCWAGTDKDGFFSVTGLPMEETTVRAEKGLFRSEGKATPGMETLSLQVDPNSVRFAYVPGVFDTVEEVLGRLGFSPEEIDETSFTSEGLADYDAVFLNCGLNPAPAEDPAVVEVFKDYVEAGGVLYASDWAETYVKEAFPGAVKFAEDPRIGDSGTHEAKVLDEGLARALGKSTATITFDAPIWTVVESVPPTTRILVSGPVVTMDGDELDDRPYMVQFEAGKGRVTYTSFHNEAQTTEDVDTLLEQLLFQL